MNRNILFGHYERNFSQTFLSRGMRFLFMLSIVYAMSDKKNPVTKYREKYK